MTASWVAMRAAPWSSTTSSHSTQNVLGASATPSRDKNSDNTTLRIRTPPIERPLPPLPARPAETHRYVRVELTPVTYARIAPEATLPGMEGLDIRGLLAEHEGQDYDLYEQTINPQFVKML